MDKSNGKIKERGRIDREKIVGDCQRDENLF